MFSRADIRRISDAIAAAELKTSGEIRVHIEPRLKSDALQRAFDLFHSLKMDKTKERNGVLILVAPNHRTFAIVGDVGIHEKVSAGFWDESRDIMQFHFREGQLIEGIVAGVKKAGEALQTYFHRQPDDVNELSDDVTMSKK